MYFTLKIHAHTQQKNKSDVADAKTKGSNSFTEFEEFHFNVFNYC